jgi:hypothetical protein
VEPSPLAEDAPSVSVLFPYVTKPRGRTTSSTPTTRSRSAGRDGRARSSATILPAADDLRTRRRVGACRRAKRMDDQRRSSLLDAGVALEVPARICRKTARRSPWRSRTTEPRARSTTSPNRGPSAGSRLGQRSGNCRLAGTATVPEGQIPVPYRFEQDLDTDTGRIRGGMDFVSRSSSPKPSADNRLGAGPPPDQYRASDSWIMTPGCDPGRVRSFLIDWF